MTSFCTNLFLQTKANEFSFFNKRRFQYLLEKNKSLLKHLHVSEAQKTSPSRRHNSYLLSICLPKKWLDLSDTFNNQKQKKDLKTLFIKSILEQNG